MRHLSIYYRNLNPLAQIALSLIACVLGLVVLIVGSGRVW